MWWVIGLVYFTPGVYVIGRILYYIPLRKSGWLVLPFSLLIWPVMWWGMEPHVRQAKYWRWVRKVMTGWKET